MQCDVCQKKEASVFYTKIVEGKMQKVNLCESCSKEKGVSDPTGFELADLLLGLGADQDVEKPPAVLKCNVCGFTQADFKKTGRLGCSACYDVFVEGLQSMLKNMHKGAAHVGKTPAGFQATKKFEERIKKLQTNLEKAVADEQYETAANLRDEIKKIESELST